MQRIKLLLVEKRAQLFVFGADMCYQKSDMCGQLWQFTNAGLVRGYSRGYLFKRLLIFFVERFMRCYSRISAFLLELLLVSEMAVNIIVKELYCLVHVVSSFSVTASRKQVVDRLKQLEVFLVDYNISCFKVFCKYIISQVVWFVNAKKKLQITKKSEKLYALCTNKYMKFLPNIKK